MTADHGTRLMARTALVFLLSLFAVMPGESATTDIGAPETKVLAALASRGDGLAREDRFSGALLVARQDKVLLRQAWGLANRESKAPVTVDTRFRLGSMNKMFTAVATLQLVEAGKLSLDGTVGTYLPDYPNRDVASKVTIRHLLTHTGGTGDIFGPAFDANRTTLREHSDYLKLYGARGPDHAPGAQMRYSNYGFVLLGVLIEKVSGMSYYDYVQRNVFGPAGMTHTASLPETDDVPNRAVGYMQQDGAWVPNTETLPYRGMAAGGGYSTLDDLLRFAEALQAGRLLTKAMLSQATQPQAGNTNYGYGFAFTGSGVSKWYGHGGGAPGMNADLRIYPESGFVVIALSNLDPPTANLLANEAGAKLAAVVRGPPPFSTLPVFLRGSFNEWGLRDRLRSSGKNAYVAEVTLHPGRHELKIGSEDFTEIDFGGAEGREDIGMNSPSHLEAVGTNLVLTVEHPGRYAFTVDASDPYAPVLDVKQIGQAAP